MSIVAASQALSPADVIGRDAVVAAAAAAAASAASTASTSAATALSTANSAGTAAAAAQTTANTGVTNAATAQSTANTASTNATSALALLNGLVVIRHAGGTVTLYSAGANTDAARGTALVTAAAALVSGDCLIGSPGDYLVGVVSNQTIAGVSTNLGLTLPSNVTFRGSGFGSRIYVDPALSTATPFYLVSNAAPTTGNTNITIEGWYLDGNNGNVTAGRQQGVVLTKCTGCRVERNWIKHFGRVGTASCIAINPVGCTDCTVHDNEMEDTVDGFNTSDSTTPCYRLTVTENRVISTNRDYAFNLYNCNDSVISNNVVKSSRLTAIHIQTNSNNNVISNNQVCGTTVGDGIRLVTNSGTFLTAPSGNLITGNKVRGCAGNGLHLTSDFTGENNTVTDNDFYGASATADVLDESADGAATYGTVIYNNRQSNSTVTTGAPAI